MRGIIPVVLSLAIAACSGESTNPLNRLLIRYEGPPGRILASHGRPAQLVLIDADGRHSRVVAPVDGYDYHWMANGEILFTGSNGGNTSIQVLDTLGNVRPFFPAAIPGVTNMISPTPSVDGNYLYFLANDSACAPHRCLYRSRMDGTDPEMIAPLLTPYGISDALPAISPDGSKVLYATGYPDDFFYMFDVATQTEKWWSVGYQAHWSPDGKYLSADCRHCFSSIWVIGPDGKGIGVAPDHDHVGLVTWSADSRYILAKSYPDSAFGVYHNYIVDINSTAGPILLPLDAGYAPIGFRAK